VPQRVLILSADIGEGHDLPARVLAGELAAERPDVEVIVEDGLAAMGRVVVAAIKDNSRITFDRLRFAFDLQYWLVTRFGAARWVASTLLYVFGARGVLALVRARDPDIVVSTYPGTTEILGILRRQGRLHMPVCSAITDLSGLHYWAHPSVDLHLVTHPESIEEVRRVAGDTEVRCVRGLTSSEFSEPRDRGEARRALGLPEDGSVVLVSGGGWGIGDLTGAVHTTLEVAPDATAVCLCGRSEEARRHVHARFATDGRVRVLGFTDRMGDLLAAADVLVHSTAGLTVLEALMRGCPVISYGFGVGHVRASNRAFSRFGLAEVASSRRQLAAALRRALAGRPEPDLTFAALPTAASQVLAALPAPVS